LRDWQENEATWNNATASSAWNQPGAAGLDRGSSILLGIQGKSLGKMTFPLNSRGVAVIQAWVDGVRQNHGFVLARGASSNELDFSSRENNTATNRPKFTIVYADTTVTANVPPTAAFTYSCTYLSCTFTDTSTDSDGSISSRLWNFGDGTTSTAQNPSHAYTVAGSYTVTLTVTDNGGASASTSKTVTVADDPNAPPVAPTNLSASVQTIGKGTTRTLIVTLTWTDNSSNESGFVVERCTQTGKGKTSACNYAPLATVGVGVTSYVDQTVYGSYKYRVRAYNANGYSAYSNEVSI
jgi:PKD repeat protein